MDVLEIEQGFASLRRARTKWNDAKRKFDTDADYIVKRLLLEAAVARMTDSQVAKAAGITRSKVRALMRKHGMDPRTSRTLLAKEAGEALAANAELMGIDVKDFDLTSPLAYLPMGREMRKTLAAKTHSQVTEVEEFDCHVHTLPVEIGEEVQRIIAEVTVCCDGSCESCVETAQRIIGLVMGMQE